MSAGLGNCVHVVAPYPSYGPGLDNWRGRLIREGNELARRLQAGELSVEWGSFGNWLESAVRAAPPSELRDLGEDL